MQLEMVSRDVYVKLTDPAGNHPPVVNHHSVHDFPKFLDAQKRMHEQAKDEECRRQVTVVTVNEYRRFKGYKGY